MEMRYNDVPRKGVTGFSKSDACTTSPPVVPVLPQSPSGINHKVRRIVFPALETVRIPLQWYTILVPSQETEDQAVGRVKMVECLGSVSQSSKFSHTVSVD